MPQDAGHAFCRCAMTLMISDSPPLATLPGLENLTHFAIDKAA